MALLDELAALLGPVPPEPDADDPVFIEEVTPRNSSPSAIVSMSPATLTRTSLAIPSLTFSSTRPKTSPPCSGG